MENKAVVVAIGAFGSIAGLAKEIGVTASAVHQWKTGVRKVPAARCPDIERATYGAVTCEQLRPDLCDNWAYLRKSRTSHQEAA